ncbi:sorbitol dehydrogenase-like [Babylonia areolata]|uniref:sorbitol dehydrogenase-like n=1 Tax=Babylonia areolata TaxID=304850 RepID=UPI003FD4B8D2
MSAKNLCAVLYGRLDMRVEERPIPEPAEGEVQIEVRAVGVCGSDLAHYRTGCGVISGVPIPQPIVLGHESCGVVSGLGPGVTDLVLGDKVAVSPKYPGCGHCLWCGEGRANLCPYAKMMSVTPTPGSLATFIVWPAKLCYRLSPKVSWEEAAMIQPMACALFGCQRAGVKPGQRLLVCGAGPLGQMIVMTAKTCLGVTRICVTDVNKERLQFIADVSGCRTLLLEDFGPRDVASHVTSLLEGAPDVSMECSGTAAGTNSAIYATRPGGCILLAGLGGDDTNIALRTAVAKSWT